MKLRIPGPYQIVFSVLTGAIGSAIVQIIATIAADHQISWLILLSIAAVVAVLTIPVFQLLGVFDWARSQIRQYVRRIRSTLSGSSEAKYVKEIADRISQSSRIRILLVSGHTMWHTDAEKPIASALESLSQSDTGKKTIQILLQDKDSESWKMRAENFIRLEGESVRLHTLDEYRKRCEIALDKFRKLVHDKAGPAIRFFAKVPLFRLFILDDGAFVGFYYPQQSGHIRGMMYIPNEPEHAAAYDALTEYFDREFSTASSG